MDKNTNKLGLSQRIIPSSLFSLIISIIAVLLSGISIYLVQFNQGNLKVLFPDKLGIGYKNENFNFVLPVTFTNSGASRQGKDILNVWVDLSSTSVPGTIRADWKFEVGFMHKIDYFKNHPNEKFRDNNDTEDFLVYNTRAYPFYIEGGRSIFKSYYLEQSDGELPTKGLENLVLTLHIQTGRGEIKKTVMYHIGEKQLDEDITYATIINTQH